MEAHEVGKDGIAPHELRLRVEERARAWGVTVERLAETPSSILAFGKRATRPVVIKVCRARGDEWGAGEVLAAMGGRGIVRALDHAGGAVLMERLSPGTPLTELVSSGSDGEATRILAGVVACRVPCAVAEAPTVPTVHDWALGFDRHATRGDERIPRRLLVDARRVYRELCASQGGPELLHGDLHHDNILLDDARGWVAIDPKGVIGEREYEVGAMLRNPCEHPAVFTNPSVIVARVECLSRTLSLNHARVLAWAYAQAVLAAIWAIEDGEALEHIDPWLELATTLRPMLRDPVDV